MTDVVDPILAALQDKANETGPPILPVHLGRTASVVVIEGPKVRFVLSSDVAYHELDTDWTAVIGLYQSLREVLGDAVTAQEDALRERIADLEHQLATAKPKK